MSAPRDTASETPARPAGSPSPASEGLRETGRLTRLLTRLTRLLQRETARTAAMVTAAVVLVAAMVALALWGQEMVDAEALEAWQASVKDTAWAPLAVVVVYVVLGLTGFPQFVMHGMTVGLFGPLLGLVYAWTGTMISAILHFWLGHAFGAKIFRRFAGEKANRLSGRLAKRGILTSALVRILPSGPFIVVNLAAGVSHIPFRKFALGTAIGTLPKIALVGFLAAGLSRFVQERDLVAVGLILGGLALWVGLGLLAKNRFKDWRAMRETEAAMADAAAAPEPEMCAPAEAPEPTPRDGTESPADPAARPYSGTAPGASPDPAADAPGRARR